MLKSTKRKDRACATLVLFFHYRELYTVAKVNWEVVYGQQICH